MFQQIMLVGNLGNDPEMRFTPSGVPVASFSLAVNKNWMSPDGERQDKTIWFRVTVWRKQAETVTQYLKKGARVLVTGEMEEARAYTDKSGAAKASLEVTANQIKFMGGKSEGGEQGQTQQAKAPATALREELRDEDIPF